MSIVNRRNALIGWATLTVVKGMAARNAKKALPSGDGGGSKSKAGGSKGKKKAVKVVAVAVATGSAIGFWKAKHRDATDYDSLASEEVGEAEEVGAPDE
jgi:hypothetical protein